MWCMNSRDAKSELKEKMQRFSARLPQSEADVVQAFLDDESLSQQAAVETLLLGMAFGEIDLRKTMRRVREIKAEREAPPKK